MGGTRTRTLLLVIARSLVTAAEWAWAALSILIAIPLGLLWACLQFMLGPLLIYIAFMVLVFVYTVVLRYPVQVLSGLGALFLAAHISKRWVLDRYDSSRLGVSRRTREIALDLVDDD